MALSPFVLAAAVLSLSSVVTSVTAAERSWYAAVGAGVSNLSPDASNATLEVTQEQSVAGSVWLGRDLTTRFSAELGVATLGEATLTGEETISYNAISGGVIAYVLGDRRAIDEREGLAMYVRGGVSVMDNESELQLERADNIALWAGAGVEWPFSRHFGVRAEVASYDGDAQAAYLGIVGRFRASRAPARIARAPQQVPQQASTPTPEPSIAQRPQIQRPVIGPRPDDASTAQAGTSQSGVPAISRPQAPASQTRLPANTAPEASAESTCVSPAPNEPVDNRGCAIFSGVVAGVDFEGGSAQLTRTGRVLLDRLAQQLLRSPSVVVEIQSHTERMASAEAATVLSRQRAIEVARQLASAGVPIERLRARAFGDTRPRADNATAGGRRLNNRIALRVLP